MEDWINQYKKCIDDPVYFYENYCTINGEKPEPLSEESKKWLRKQRVITTDRIGIIGQRTVNIAAIIAALKEMDN
jgi:hypothetical protein